jgi:hypothetical protein
VAFDNVRREETTRSASPSGGRGGGVIAQCHSILIMDLMHVTLAGGDQVLAGKVYAVPARATATVTVPASARRP